MSVSARGSKHVCPECTTKYYDLRRDIVVCPKCGAKPAPPKLRRSGQPAKKTAPVRFGRYP